MDNKKSIIEKIKKVMALAENNPNQNEAIAAALKAQEMMAKFHIKEEDLGIELKEDNIDKLECVLSGKAQKWRLQLAITLAKNFRCKIYLTDGNVTFYGYEEDIKICSEVFRSLYSIGVKLSDKEKREARKKYGTATGVRNSFCIGFVQGIQSELEKQCTALMIVVPKEVNDKYDEMFKNKKSRTVSASVSANDFRMYNKGFECGKDAIRSKGIESRQ